jgi:hypothetical protein
MLVKMVTEEEILKKFKNVTSKDINDALSKNLDEWEKYHDECDRRRLREMAAAKDMVIGPDC